MHKVTMIFSVPDKSTITWQWGVWCRVMNAPNNRHMVKRWHLNNDTSCIIQHLQNFILVYLRQYPQVERSHSHYLMLQDWSENTTWNLKWNLAHSWYAARCNSAEGLNEINPWHKNTHRSLWGRLLSTALALFVKLLTFLWSSLPLSWQWQPNFRQ